MTDLQKRISNLLKLLRRDAAPWSQRDRDAVERLASSVETLISTTSPSVQARIEAADLLRLSLPSFYKKFRSASLQLSVSVFSFIVRSKVAAAYKSRQEADMESWQLPAEAIINGVLDYFESQSENEANSELKLDIGKIYYAEICKLFFSPLFPVPWTSFSLNLRVATYTLLTYTAQYCTPNQVKLRKLLKGDNLGSIIVSTKDILALDELLNVLATLIPVTKGHADGRERRMVFIRECFLHTPIRHPRGKDIVGILDNISSSNWEETSERIIDMLAKELEFPQPFVFDTFYVSGLATPHTEPVKRCYLDSMSILFNCVNDKDNTLEMSVVPYSSIRRISISEIGTVLVELSSPPIYHKTVLRAASGTSSSSITMTLTFTEDQIDRLLRTLRCRGLENRIVYNGTTLRSRTNRISINKVPTRLEFYDDSRIISQSYEERVKIVEEGVQQLSDAGDDAPLDGRFVVEDGGTISRMVAFATLADDQGNLGPQIPALSVLDVASSTEPIIPSASISSPIAKRGPPDPNKVNVQLQEDLFGSNDDLSDLSDVESVDEATRRASHLRNATGTTSRFKTVDPATPKVAVIGQAPSQSAPTSKPKPTSSARASRVVDPQSADESRLSPSPTQAIKKRLVTKGKGRSTREAARPNPASSTAVPAASPEGKYTTSRQKKNAQPKAGRVKPLQAPKELEAPSKPVGHRGRPTRASAAAASKKIAALEAQSGPIELDNSHISALQSPTSRSVVIADDNSDNSSKDGGKTKSATTPAPHSKNPPVQHDKRPANTPKRKREVAPDEEVSVLNEASFDPLPTKRARVEAKVDTQSGIQPKRSESQDVRPRTTATTRAKKKYGNRSRKDKVSTPSTSAAPLDSVDYDEIPGGASPARADKPWSSLFEGGSSSPARVPMAGAQSKVSGMKTKDRNKNMKQDQKPKPRWKKVENRPEIRVEDDPSLPATSPTLMDVPIAHGDDRSPSPISNVIESGQFKAKPTSPPAERPPKPLIEDDDTPDLRSSVTAPKESRPGPKTVPTSKVEPTDARFQSASANPPSSVSAPKLAPRGTQDSPIELDLHELDSSAMVTEPNLPPSLTMKSSIKPEAEVNATLRSLTKTLDPSEDPLDIQPIDRTQTVTSPPKRAKVKAKAITPLPSEARSITQTPQNDFNFEEGEEIFEDKHEDYHVILNTSLGLPPFDLEPTEEGHDEKSERAVVQQDIRESSPPRRSKFATVSFAPPNVIVDEDEADEDTLLNLDTELQPEPRETKTISAVSGGPRPESPSRKPLLQRLVPLPVQEKQPRDRLFASSMLPLKSSKDTKRKRQSATETPDDVVDELDACVEEITTIIKDLGYFVANQVREGFTGMKDNVFVLRNRFLQQLARELREINDENTHTHNELISLENAYADYSARKLTAFEYAVQSAGEGCQQVEDVIKEHDRRAIRRAKRAVVAPLPASVLRLTQ
ncbi:hypothetical protein OF83DRAFT_1116523 [Amylostereum chailletii]|nr:hypothetical protein OF83DRAFT_1116523 [Amylostereum chailletii]